jgi:murein DD-endopeptidase MepM/ murein hydrolase activator NlpD
MPNISPQKPVVAVALDRWGGDAAVRRCLAGGLPVVAFAERGVALPAQVDERVEVPVNHARVGPAIRDAVSRNTAWVAVPRTMGTSDYLVSAALRSVGTHVDRDHPGIALLVVSPDREPEVPYRRALTVVDLTGRATSGMTGLAAVEICAHLGTGLDVLVLGAPDGPPPGSNEEWRPLLPVDRRSELLRQAVQLVDEYGVDVTWQTAPSSDPLTAVAEAVETGRYDLVIGSVGGHRLRKRFGKRHDIRRLVDDPAEGGVVRHLLQDTTCDVLVVLDAITLGMIPATAVRSSAAAALALGVIGMGTPVAQSALGEPGGASSVVVRAASDAVVETSSTRPASPEGDKAASGETDAQTNAEPASAKTADKKAQRNKASEKAEKGKAGEKAEKGKASEKKPNDEPVDLSKVTAEQVAKAERKSFDAQTKASIAEQEAARAKQQVKTAKAEAKQAAERFEEARTKAEPAAEVLAETRLQMGEAMKASLLAEQEYEQAQERLNVVTDLVTGGRATKEAEEAAAAADAAEGKAQWTQSAEAAAHQEYLEFAAEVEAAEAEFVAASDDIARAHRQLAEKAEKAESAAKRSARLAREARALDEVLAEQGLHAPATGSVTSPFGPRVHPVTGVYKQHTGTDFQGTDGNYYAAAAGEVTYAGYDGAYGYMVKIDHGSVGGQHMETWYAHQPGLSVAVGQHVDRGQVIGQIGSTGYSTGPHAHVELHVNGQPVDLISHLH